MDNQINITSLWVVFTFIGNLGDFFPLISTSINKLTRILKIICQCDAKHTMMFTDKNNDIFKGLAYLITSITGHTIRLIAKLVIWSVSTFKMDVLLYVYIILQF